MPLVLFYGKKTKMQNWGSLLVDTDYAPPSKHMLLFTGAPCCLGTPLLP